MRRVRPGIVLLALLVAACPEPAPAEPTALAVAEGWVRVTDPAVDVFAAERPPEAVCDDSGYAVEPIEQSFEVRTGVCDYLTVRQGALEPLAPGDVVEIRVAHEELVSPIASEGYVGLAIDGEIVWEGRTPIPGPAGVLKGEVTIERALPEGAELQFHVHNHGANSWALLSVMVTPGGG